MDRITLIAGKVAASRSDRSNRLSGLYGRFCADLYFPDTVDKALELLFVLKDQNGPYASRSPAAADIEPHHFKKGNFHPSFRYCSA
jgi:hypothetical protein